MGTLKTSKKFSSNLGEQDTNKKMVFSVCDALLGEEGEENFTYIQSGPALAVNSQERFQMCNMMKTPTIASAGSAKANFILVINRNWLKI